MAVETMYPYTFYMVKGYQKCISIVIASLAFMVLLMKGQWCVL